ncbi:MAG: RNA polymerase-binding protein RbpA [Microbacteriaceae bacterium]
MANKTIRGSRLGSSMVNQEQNSIAYVDRIAISYWNIHGNETVRYFVADIDPADIPEVIDCPKTGLPAGRDKNNPPGSENTEPYKTHLAYVKERRTAAEAETLLNEALEKLRSRRGQLPRTSEDSQTSS